MPRGVVILKLRILTLELGELGGEARVFLGEYSSLLHEGGEVVFEEEVLFEEGSVFVKDGGVLFLLLRWLVAGFLAEVGTYLLDLC